MSLYDKITWGIAALLILPVLLNPAGWAFGVTIAVIWIVAAYGAKYLLDLEKQRRQGERGFAYEVRNRGRGGEK